ncbi:MAG: response regulator [Deltaproteobacteria bacterium]|nr:response regulator [Deltaproteobacteria bacterium]
MDNEKDTNVKKDEEHGVVEKPFTTGEVAMLSHVSINAVKKWIASGKLKAFKTPGGHFRIRRDDFESFVLRYRFHIKGKLPGEKKRVLIVDDEPAIVSFLRDTLLQDSEEYDVETAENGYDALIKVGSFRPDLLVLDLRMPGLNGIEVCRRMKEELATSDIKILVVTAFSSTDKDSALISGADYCMEKPIHMEEFRSEVKRLLL